MVKELKRKIHHYERKKLWESGLGTIQPKLLYQEEAQLSMVMVSLCKHLSKLIKLYTSNVCNLLYVSQPKRNKKKEGREGEREGRKESTQATDIWKQTSIHL